MGPGPKVRWSTSMTRTNVMTGVMLAVIAGAALAGPASAKTATQIRADALDRRAASEQAEIDNGRRNGSLTWWEKFRLEREQRRIALLEADAKRDGKITRREYYFVKRAETDAARHIYADEHNPYVRGWFWRTFLR